MEPLTHQDSTFNFDFSFEMPNQTFNALKASGQGNTASGYFDEGIDTTTSSGSIFGQQSFDSIFDPSMSTGFGMEQPLTLDNTSGGASWGNVSANTTMTTFPATPAQSFDSIYNPQFSGAALGKRPLQLDVSDFPQAKRHESVGYSPFTGSASVTGSSWAVDTQPTPSSCGDVGLSDEAADVCATWFSKYNVLPSDRHIDSLSQLTGESPTAIRHWFGQALKQGMTYDSAYKSQTGFPQQQVDPIMFTGSSGPSDTSAPLFPELACSTDAQVTTAATTTTQGPLRGGRKGCNPTKDPELLKRDPNKIYQCTRKCGKRYGRKCDWKRNEEEGYPSKSWICALCVSQGDVRVKPCFRKYHFSQHFRNIHPGLNYADYEQASTVESDTDFPKKCGFCPHRFTERQDRIDHISEHFKQGKCMLDWVDDDDESRDSDNTDDNDDDNDRPDSGGFDNSRPFFPPNQDQQGGGSSSKHNGNGGHGGSGGSGQQSPQGGFFQFHLAQSTEATGTDASCANTHIRRGECNSSSSDKEHVHGGSDATEATHSNALAGDAITQPLNRLHSEGDRSLDQGQRGSRKSVDALKPVTVGQIPSSIAPDPPIEVDLLSEGLAGASPLNRSNDDERRTALIRAAELGNREVVQLLLDQGDRHINEDRRKTALHAAAASGHEEVVKLLLKRGGIDFDPMSNETRSALDPGAPYSAIDAVRRSVSPLDSQSFLSLKLLGTGGFSTVDEVVHRETSLRVSRKTLKNRDQSALEEMKKEVDVLQKLRHPHVVRFLGAYSKGDKMSILLSPVAETNLAAWLDKFAQNRPAGLSQIIVSMLGCLSSTVRYLHEQRPVVKHMDIKPQNILVMQGNQEFPHVVLSDFGISSFEETDSQGKSKPITRQYCAPEVSEGISREQAADIWSLGCVFAEMATVAFSEGNSNWLDFRREFRGREGKYYWQDVPALHNWLSLFLEASKDLTETTVVRTVKSMLNPEPTLRPNAAKLTMTFTPAPCCLSWPNEKVSYPGPLEESASVEMLVREDGVDCCAHLHLHGDTEDKQLCDSITHAKSWLDECSHEHDACRQQLGRTRPLPTRLVDIRPNGVAAGAVRIVDSAQLDSSSGSVDYISLGYLWGSNEPILSTDRLHAMQSELARDSLPRALNEAISAAERIGYRYIWVDSLCVLQDSEEDKERECLATADVYRNSALTIVLDQLNASVSEQASIHEHSSTTGDGIPQPSRTPSWTESSIAALPAIDFQTPGFGWDTRAWALQERFLSPRHLHLGEQQMYWECNALKASETFPRGLPPLLWEKVHTKPSSDVTTQLLGYTLKHELATHVEPEAINKESTGKARPMNECLRNQQWVRKEGDGIGDAMEAQMQLELCAAEHRRSADTIDNVKSKIHGSDRDDLLRQVIEKEPNMRPIQHRGVNETNDIIKNNLPLSTTGDADFWFCQPSGTAEHFTEHFNATLDHHARGGMSDDRVGTDLWIGNGGELDVSGNGNVNKGSEGNLAGVNVGMNGNGEGLNMDGDGMNADADGDAGFMGLFL
ncbi:hypothetical protein K458DRAFT_165705 [Lentithecium fluviatile CBS 122367]|uniref:Protein kinase domain-containing protein n=1 Tax=Lentithecium fluviatile CBS 122367 TaxID=1168545 RepID=A0A6G1IGJ3_9PLEO|nr:hypothetical protein K458DRAFT_165705 [Lentithecium fluviatile CBS 122367]